LKNKMAISKKPAKISKYHEGLGRRKTSIARVRLFNKEGESTVNEKSVKDYFKTARQRRDALLAITELKLANLSFSAKVKGGGLSSQAEAVRHGISRALLKLNPIFKKRLRKLGYLTRDSRMVERKKYGLKKSRRAPQWAKR